MSELYIKINEINMQWKLIFPEQMFSNAPSYKKNWHLHAIQLNISIDVTQFIY